MPETPLDDADVAAAQALALTQAVSEVIANKSVGLSGDEIDDLASEIAQYLVGLGYQR